jgi:catechol 2,3-dioxygenase-like lactoylglutathione lyase family enzyme
MSIDINGIAHIYITVQDMGRVKPFYEKMLAAFGMQCLVDTPELYYCVGARTGVGIRAGHADAEFDQYHAGLHHLCFRARNRDSVDLLAALIEPMGGRLVHPPTEDDWAPGYYSVLFEDPCGTRLEVNYVPGKGNLDAAVDIPLAQTIQGELSAE